MRTWEAIKSYSDIRFEFYEGIAKITIDREIVYNAFRPETNNQMLEAMDICREREDIDVVVFTRSNISIKAIRNLIACNMYSTKMHL